MKIIGKTEERKEKNASGWKCRNSSRSVYGCFKVK